MPDENNSADQNQAQNSPTLDAQQTSNDPGAPQPPSSDERQIQNLVNEVAGNTQQTPQPQEAQTATPKPVVEETSAPPPPSPPSMDSGDGLGSNPPPPPPTQNEKEEKETLPPPPSPPGDGGDQSGNQPPGGIPPVVSSPKSKKKFGGKKMIATVLGILFLLGGVGAGVILVQNNQDVRERASIIADECTPNQSQTGPCNPGGGCDGERTRVCRTNGVWGAWGNCRTTSCPDPEEDDDGGGTRNDTTKKDNGEFCTSNSQCTSGNCLETPGAAPGEGTCAPAGEENSACVQQGGQCYSSPNCFSLNRSLFNGGNGCDAGTGEICCTRTTTGDENGTTRTDDNNEPLSDYCDASGCDVGSDFNSGANGCWVNRYHCDVRSPGGCSGAANQTSDVGVQSATFQENCGTEQIDVTDGCPKDSYPENNQLADFVSRNYDNDCSSGNGSDSTLRCQCLNIQAFDAEWNKLSTAELSQLSTGDTVRFTVSGTTNSGAIDMARFTINNTLRPAVTQKRPGTNEFYDEYAIPEGTTSFSISAELHHTSPQINWF